MTYDGVHTQDYWGCEQFNKGVPTPWAALIFFVVESQRWLQQGDDYNRKPRYLFECSIVG